jgi:hypothetical protein
MTYALRPSAARTVNDFPQEENNQMAAAMIYPHRAGAVQEYFAG